MSKRESCASILLAPRPSSRSPPTYDPHSTRCTAGCHTPATSCIGAFRPPAVGVRGETIIPAAENLHLKRHRARGYESVAFRWLTGRTADKPKRGDLRVEQRSDCDQL